MNDWELRKAIKEDVITLKNLEPDIIPASTYYPRVLKTIWGGFWKLWLISMITLSYVCINNPTHSSMIAEPAFHIIRGSALISIGLAIIGTFILSMSFSFYNQVRFHLEHTLKTGPLLVKKLKQVGYIFLVALTLLCMLFASYAESAQIILLLVFAFVGAFIITYLIVSSEFKRIGISAIVSVIHEFFQKRKSPVITEE